MANLSGGGKKEKQENRQHKALDREYIHMVGIPASCTDFVFLQVFNLRNNKLPLETMMYDLDYSEFSKHRNMMLWLEDKMIIEEEKMKNEEELAKSQMRGKVPKGF